MLRRAAVIALGEKLFRLFLELHQQTREVHLRRSFRRPKDSVSPRNGLCSGGRKAVSRRFYRIFCSTAATTSSHRFCAKNPTSKLLFPRPPEFPHNQTGVPPRSAYRDTRPSRTPSHSPIVPAELLVNS